MPVKSAKKKSKPYKITDGGGMYLLVSPKGAKLWRYKYRLNGKEDTFAIGAYPEITVAKARESRAGSRELVRQGVHPLHHRKAETLYLSAAAHIDSLLPHVWQLTA